MLVASLKTHLRSNKHCPRATRARSEEKVQKKQPCRYWGLQRRKGRRCSKSQSRFPCSPWRHGQVQSQNHRTSCSPAAQEGQHGNRKPPCILKEPTAHAGAVLKELVPHGSSFCRTAWHGREPMLEQGYSAGKEWQWQSVMNWPQLPHSPSPCAKYGELVEELGMKECGWAWGVQVRWRGYFYFQQSFSILKLKMH